ncbi:hypothetical protein [Mesorhizobium sp.]|uniref:hypothetical protein n=1 Tax=Mesorhizobium sp. TaxID=1871066 RepID=UPI0007ED1833|nr:hypothetical protein [Mesorhizobium sp.]RWD32695.1 MAG: hypothetical protein EOS34_21555 [Mesorhizobium sp.]RWD80448.1 MAG: hypothetical protein EOS48_17850 [Mesorhizobium sp.]TIS37402.1 MAG: hypothetical protein E5W95_17420 [Mesorhizobium sp.]
MRESKSREARRVLSWPSAMKVIGEVAYKAVIARDSMSHIDDIAGGLLYDVPCPSAPTTSSKSTSRSCGARRRTPASTWLAENRVRADGVPNKATRERQLAIAASGSVPLDVIIKRMRCHERNSDLALKANNDVEAERHLKEADRRHRRGAIRDPKLSAIEMNGEFGAGVANVVGVGNNEDRRNRVTRLDEVKCPPSHSNPDLQRGSVERQHRVMGVNSARANELPHRVEPCRSGSGETPTVNLCPNNAQGPTGESNKPAASRLRAFFAANMAGTNGLIRVAVMLQ